MVITSLYSLLLFLFFLLSKSLATFLPIDLYPREKHHHASPRPESPDRAGSLENVADALASMQDLYFEHYQGTWPSAIDWTAAFIQTIATAGLSTISQALSSSEPDSDVSRTAKENLVDMFFDQIVGSYFGQDAVGIRGQAFDDILWVVLGWLEAVQFVDRHSELHYPLSAKKQDLEAGGIGSILANVSWHGNGWTPTFAHRSRVFWDLASKGWDTRLCGGGMNWNPRLIPYKNAITNELWISASIKMYLYFPGDNIRSPFRAGSTTTSSNCPAKSHDGNKNLPPCPPRDPKFLEAAILGYKWLMNSNMTNNIGLFVDGFHVRNLRHGGTKCDARNEDVYTYNQGVLLTGQRGLYEATGASSYLEEGHALIQNVIAATGWNLQHGAPFDEVDKNGSGLLPPWHGLGRAGVLEERCDALAYCSQNGQTFKGIFMHHLTTFCAPILSDSPVVPGVRYDDAVIHAHRSQCLLYAPWVKRNAQAALGTRNADGKFGMWWTVGLLGWDDEKDVKLKLPAWEMTPEHGTVDYRSHGLPDDGVWQPQGVPPLWTPEEGNVDAVRLPSWRWDYVPDEEGDEAMNNGFDANDGQKVISRSGHATDPNDRGRGRTVETQAGGLSVLRAAFEFGKLEDAAAVASAGTKPLEL